MEKEDLFGEVADQLEGEANWSQLELFDETQEVFRHEPSWGSISNLSGSGEFLKRKPSKPRERVVKNALYQTQIIPKCSQIPPRIACLDLQLNRLERTLNFSKSKSINPQMKRQKTLLKRLGISNKQNKSIKDTKKDQSFVVTSQFLQEIKGVSEQLYDIYLSLNRFYQNEKEENQTIGKQIKQINKDMQKNAIILQQLKSKLSEINEKINNQVSSEDIAQKKIMKLSFQKYFKSFQQD